MSIRRALTNGIVLAALVTVVLVGVAQAPAVDRAPAQVLATQITSYFDGRQGAMALNFDTELYLCGMIHSMNGYDPVSATDRSQDTRVGWPNILQDAAAYGIPLSFNICGHEAVFGDTGRDEISAIDLLYSWHSDSHWATNTWYSDKPLNGGNYLTMGDLSGTTMSYGLVYGGDLTEQTLNSSVPHEISYHNFGHESLSDITAAVMDDTFRLGVEYHKRIGSKIRAEAPPWNNNPQSEKYPIYVQNHLFAFNRMEGASSTPYEVIDNLWVIPRADAFTASTDMTSLIDGAITDGVVLANYSHPEDGFQSTSRGGFPDLAGPRKGQGGLWGVVGDHAQRDRALLGGQERCRGRFAAARGKDDRRYHVDQLRRDDVWHPVLDLHIVDARRQRLREGHGGFPDDPDAQFQLEHGSSGRWCRHLHDLPESCRNDPR